MKLKSESLTRNIATNTASYLTTLGAAFLMFPIMIHKLGPARYGLWMLISELTGYYSYLGLGIRAGVAYYAAMYLAQDQRRELNRTLSTSLWSLAALGTVLALSGLGLAAAFPAIFQLSGLDVGETSRSVMIMALAVGLSLPVEAMNSTLTAAKRLDIVNGIEMATRLVSSIGMLVCVVGGRGLVALSLIQLGTRIAAAPLTYVALRRTIPGLSLSPGNWHFESLWRLGRFGLPSVLIGAGWLISSRTDLIVIGMVLGVPMVAYYAIPRSLMEYADAGIRAIAWSYTSHLTHLHARESPQETMKLYLEGARIISVAVFLMTAYIAAFGTSFLAIWQGSAFVTGEWRNRASVVLLVLIAAFLPRLLHNMAGQLFYSTNRLMFLMWLSLLEGAIKIILSLVLVKPWGLAGVAVSNLIPMLVFEGAAIPIYLLRNYPIDSGRYLRNVIGRPLLVGIIAYLSAAVLVISNPPGGWVVFCAEAGCSVLIGALVALWIGASSEERAGMRQWLVLQ